ncbi:MAG: four helix bundle protein [Fibrobacter sp.]|nr:four helix bundle protein [Fibrobacter sp.]
MRKFQDLSIWQKSHKLTLDVYDATRKLFPKEELFALTSQIRRAASSIPTNIAEGCGRKSNTELARFLHIASGSATEVEYQLLLARDLQYIDSTRFEKLNREIVEIRKMIISFIKKIPDVEPGTANIRPRSSSLKPGA